MSQGKPTHLDCIMMKKAIDLANNALARGKVGIGSLLLWKDETLALEHNMYADSHDVTDHAEMVVLHRAAQRLDQMNEEEKQALTLYTTLEPCLMCFAAISFAGIKRVVYSALVEDGKQEIQIIQGITIHDINQVLVRGPIELIPGVMREEGRILLQKMGKLA